MHFILYSCYSGYIIIEENFKHHKQVILIKNRSVGHSQYNRKFLPQNFWWFAINPKAVFISLPDQMENDLLHWRIQ